MSRDRTIWFKGKLVPAHSAMVSVLSPTAQYGLNVFEGIRGYWNANAGQLLLFRVEDHLKRLFQSCKLIGLTCPYSSDEIREFIRTTLTHNEYREDVALRVTLFVDEEGTWSSSDPVSMFIAPIAKNRTDLARLHGKRACTSTWRRIDDRSLPPRVKAGANYINGRYAQLEATRNGYDLPLLLGINDKISEGAGACLFIVQNGSLVTPPASNSILESITRDTIFALAQLSGVRVVEKEIDRTELYLADEVFLCGSAAEITPITSVDKIAVANEEVGELTNTLLASYLELVSDTESAFPEWRMPVYVNEGQLSRC